VGVAVVIPSAAVAPNAARRETPRLSAATSLALALALAAAAATSGLQSEAVHRPRPDLEQQFWAGANELAIACAIRLGANGRRRPMALIAPHTRAMQFFEGTGMTSQLQSIDLSLYARGVEQDP
jgi:hypothetical protein